MPNIHLWDFAAGVCWLMTPECVFVQGLFQCTTFPTPLCISGFPAMLCTGIPCFGLPAPSQQVDHKLGSDVDIGFHSSCWSCGTSVSLLWLMASQKWSNKGYDGWVLTSCPSFCLMAVFLGNSLRPTGCILNISQWCAIFYEVVLVFKYNKAAASPPPFVFSSRKMIWLSFR